MSAAAASSSTARTAAVATTTVDTNRDLIDGRVELASLKLASHEHLVAQDERVDCPTCGRRRKYFCYDCLCPLGDTDAAPHVDLPIKLDM